MNRKMERRTTEDQIDIVISWVDGNDPDHKRKIDAYRSGQKYSKADDVAGKTRFANNGEINFCVASINRYADFVRQIFIITDGQDPCLDEFINKHFDNPVPVRIIDHKTIFETPIASASICCVKSFFFRASRILIPISSCSIGSIPHTNSFILVLLV